ncbi:MAG: helix-turn-helix domain-containing protein [Boseongicola sp.]
MLTETLSEGLESYRIGPKIRSLRTEKALGLAQLSDHTGLSAGMLSKLERGQIFPTLPTLMRIALVFGVGLDHFFDQGDAPVLEVIRAKNRIKLPNTTEAMPSFYFESLDFPVNDRPIEAYLAEFVPRTPHTDPHEHKGIELVYVISGEIEIKIHGATHELCAKDSMFFDSQYSHSYKCSGEDRATAIVVAAKGGER